MRPQLKSKVKFYDMQTSNQMTINGTNQNDICFVGQYATDRFDMLIHMKCLLRYTYDNSFFQSIIISE